MVSGVSFGGVISTDFSLFENKAKGPWDERFIKKLNVIDEKLNEALPNFLFQEKIDRLGCFIERQFANLVPFNQWLQANGQGNWYQQLAVYLFKLPMRAIRNIVQMLYNLVKEAMHLLVHPLKGTNRLVKLAVLFAKQLTEPKTWSMMGAGMVGASLGQGVITGNPFSVVGLLVGGALVGAGLTAGAIQKNFREHLKGLPESLMTGFFMGLLVGAIQRGTAKSGKVASQEQAEKYADRLVKKHGLPEYSKVEVDPSGKVTVKWVGDLESFEQMYPKVFGDHQGPYEFCSQVKLELNPGGQSDIVIRMYGHDGFEGYHYFKGATLNDFGWSDKMPGFSPDNEILRSGGWAGGVLGQGHGQGQGQG